jgi:hypothetical protein
MREREPWAGLSARSSSESRPAGESRHLRGYVGEVLAELCEQPALAVADRPATMGDYDLDRVRFPRRITESTHAQAPVVGKATQTSSLNGAPAALSPTPGGNGLYASP